MVADVQVMPLVPPSNLSKTSTPSRGTSQRRGFLLERDGFRTRISLDGKYRVGVWINGVAKLSEPLEESEAFEQAKSVKQAWSSKKADFKARKIGRPFIEPNWPMAYQIVTSSEGSEGHFVDTLECGHKIPRKHPTATPRRKCWHCDKLSPDQRRKLIEQNTRRPA